jgi:hypothetical protein
VSSARGRPGRRHTAGPELEGRQDAGAVARVLDADRPPGGVHPVAGQGDVAAGVHQDVMCGQGAAKELARPLHGPALDQPGRLEQPRPGRAVREPAVEPAVGAVPRVPAQPCHLADVGRRVVEGQLAAPDAADRAVALPGAEHGVDVVQAADGAGRGGGDLRIGTSLRAADVDAHRHSHDLLDVDEAVVHR